MPKYLVYNTYKLSTPCGKFDLYQKTAGKWQKIETYVGALTLWLETWASHELGGLALHQCR